MSELKIGDKAPNFSMSAAEGDHSNPRAKFFPLLNESIQLT